MEEAAVLRHLIRHFQELVDVDGSPSTTQFYDSTQSFLSHHPSLEPFSPRCCFLNLDENPTKLSHTDVIMRPEKPANFKMSGPQKLPPAKRPCRAQNDSKPMTDQPECMMDEQIWKEFPEDLLEAVVARLPIASFFRLRSVSKKWNSLLYAQSFFHHCSQLTRRHGPWFYTITQENVNTGVVYDPTARKWHCPTHPPFVPPKMILLPAASAGGLVCFINIVYSCFFVCNPLTQTWKKLPPHSVKGWSRIAVGMCLTTTKKGGGSHVSHNYTILWAGQDGEYTVYDSESNSWVCQGTVPADTVRLPLALNFRSQAVSVGTTIYFLRSNPEGLVSYDVMSGKWSQVAVPVPPRTVDHALAESRGKLVLVGLVTRNAATCVCVWELQRMTLLWKEVDRMPNVWCLEFYGKHVRMSCLGNKGLIMLSLKSRQMNRIVMYDIATREWSKVPGCCVPYGGRGRKRQWMTGGIAFYPCLTTTP